MMELGVNQNIPLTKVSLSEKFSLFQDHFSPKIVGELNDSHVKLVKLQGEFVWHHHDHEDEMFLVVKGCLFMGLQEAGRSEREIAIHPGEFIIIPKGVEHKPRADEETHIMLLEPKTTLNTGNVRGERTVEQLARI